VQHVRAKYPVTERRACRVLGQSRTSQRYQPIIRDDEGPLTAAVIRLAGQYGRYGYRRVTALLRAEGWHVNHKRVERIWRREGVRRKRHWFKRSAERFRQNSRSGAGYG
jgi:transposase InsO family protein